MIDEDLTESELEVLMYSITNYLNEDFKFATYKEFLDERRWVIRWTQVFQHVPSSRFLRITWDTGKTEMQEASEPNFFYKEVQPKTRTITVYE